MARFIYQSINFVHQTGYVMVDGETVEIKFTGGQSTPVKICGKFNTDNPKLQKALDNSPEYGKSWIRILPLKGKEPAIPAAAPELPANPTIPPDPENPPATGNDAEKGEEGSDAGTGENNPHKPIDPVIIAGLSTFQAVKEYLRNNVKGIAFSDIQSKENCYKKASELGFSFPDWKYPEA